MTISYIGGSCTTITSPVSFLQNQTYVTPYVVPSNGAIVSACFRVRKIGSVTAPNGHITLIILRPNGSNWDYVGESPSIEVVNSSGETLTVSCNIITNIGDRIGWYSDSNCAVDILSNNGSYNYYSTTGKQTGANFSLPNDVYRDYGDAGIVVTFDTIIPYTHSLDLIVEPWSWYTPNGAVDAITQKLGDVNGTIINFFTHFGIIDYQYIGTEVFKNTNNEVIIRLKLKNTGILSMAAPLTIFYIAILIASIGLVLIFVGKIISYIFGDNRINLTNEQLTTAGQEFMKALTNDCETKTCSDPTLTQDQKVLCINNCVNSGLTRWKEYQTTIYPDADHTPLDTGLTNIQTCLDIYNTSNKTLIDYQTYINCNKVKRDEAIDSDKEKTLDTYDPNATAGGKDGPNNLLTTITWIGGGLAVGYIGYKLLSSKKDNSNK